MDREGTMDRRKALGKFGRVGLAATATAGLAGLLGRPSTAQASGPACGGNNPIFIIAPGTCTIKCPSGYWCYHAFNQYSGAWGNRYCCASEGEGLICACQRPT